MPERRTEKALDFHAASVAKLVSEAESVDPGRWNEPLAEGKWSPAEVVSHLVAVYDVVLSELRGGQGMAVRTQFLMRMILRLTVAPRIIRKGIFPSGVRAPRETRPVETMNDRVQAIARFRERAGEFERAAREAPAGQKVTHAYFGAAPLPIGITLVSRHIDHHRKQIESR